MKKLNRKGFTLVELLAVIVILAIVVGITMTTILPTLESSRKQAFETAVETIRTYVKSEYDKCKVGDSTIAGTQTIVFSADCSAITTSNDGVATNAGYDPVNDIKINSITIDTTNGNVTVEAYALGGKFKNKTYTTTTSLYTAS